MPSPMLEQEAQTFVLRDSVLPALAIGSPQQTQIRGCIDEGPQLSAIRFHPAGGLPESRPCGYEPQAVSGGVNMREKRRFENAARF
jgi:hypothetical protein